MKSVKSIFSLLIVLCCSVTLPCCMMHMGMTHERERHPEEVSHGGWVKTELIFGLSTADGDTLSDAEWQHFVDEEITPRFQDGLTIIKSSGQWMSPNLHQLIKEASYIVIMVYKPNHETDMKIEAIRSVYKKRFSQESVLRIDTETDVSF
jgi:hypothetical protein